MKNNKSNNVKSAKETCVPSLSTVKIEDVEEKILTAINNQELQKGIEKWLKDNKENQRELNRDLNLLGSVISEYLDSFILFGYNLDGERVIIQNYNKPKDKDALMEFLKIVFLKHHQGEMYD